MLPLVGPGDLLYCLKDKARRLTYGDLVIYEIHDKWGEGSKFNKMVVGLAGDTVQMKDGVLWINSDAIPRRRVADFQMTGSNGNKVPQFEETLPRGRKTFVLSVDPESRYNNTAPTAVPAKNVFVMGSNRDHSIDSRSLSLHGPVPIDNVICKAAVDDGTRLRSISSKPISTP